MSHRLAPLGRLAAILGALALAIAACSSSSAPTSSPAGGATPAAASPVASAAGPSLALPSGIALPSFNADTDLEAAFPNEFCGQKTIKYSFSGADANTDPNLAAIVVQLGRSPGDVSLATAGVQGPECLGINLIALRIKGADQGRYEQLFIDGQEKDSGTRPTKSNVGGKDVWVFTETGTTNYLYFKGDTAFGVTAKTQADAAKGLQVLP